MPRPLFFLLAMLLLARPGSARAGTPLLAVPDEVVTGQRLELHWEGLPNAVDEVELELSLDGGRWVRISPELAAGEGRFVWNVPEVVSSGARLRLRAGGAGFEREIAASAPFRIASRRTVAGMGSGGPDWWRVGEHSRGPGWEADGRAASLIPEGQTCSVDTGSRSQVSAPGSFRVVAPAGGARTTSSSRDPGAAAASSQRYPMRL
jgi:hypothetical protein